MSLHEIPLVIGVASTLLPVVAALLRGRSTLLTIATLFFGVTISFYQIAVLRLIQIGSLDAPNAWVYGLVATATPLLLAAYVLSVTLGRERPRKALLDSKHTILALVLGGAVLLVWLRHPSFIAGYWGAGEAATISLGPLGKAYVSYILLGLVVVGYNLERTYRSTASDSRHRLRLPYLALFSLLAYFTFVLSTGILYSSLGLGKLLASGIPIALANTVAGYVFLRGALTDVAAPVSRRIVYSSFTALAAALYVGAVAVVGQVAHFTNWSPDEVVTLSFGFLAAIVAILLLFSNRFQRRARRFIDRNFYVNRYDYRTQWSNLTRALETTVERDSVLRRAEAIVKDVFLADEVTIALRHGASRDICPKTGKGVECDDATLLVDSPLYVKLCHERSALLLDHRSDDFEYIPIYAENRHWLATTASQIVAPLLAGDDLVGTVGLQRSHKDDPFTFEDVELLDSVAGHLSACMRSLELAEELAESREMRVISQWSDMLLHDFKNYLTPLRMIAQNLERFGESPEVNEIAARDVNRVTQRMETLVSNLARLRENPHFTMSEIDVNEMIRQTLTDMQIDRVSFEVQLELQATTHVFGDESMLRRVVENLITNALEAMSGEDTLRIATGDDGSSGNGSQVHLSVADTGRGIPEDFLRDRLFRPFATTKRDGVGLGLYQSRMIVRAHGGQLEIDSKPQVGTIAHVTLAANGLSRSKSAEPSVSGAA